MRIAGAPFHGSVCVDVCIPLSDSAEGDRGLGEVRGFTAASWERPSAACGCQVVSSLLWARREEGRTEQGLVARRAPGVLPHVRLGGGRRLFRGGGGGSVTGAFRGKRGLDWSPESGRAGWEGLRPRGGGRDAGRWRFLSGEMRGLEFWFKIAVRRL